MSTARRLSRRSARSPIPTGRFSGFDCPTRRRRRAKLSTEGSRLVEKIGEASAAASGLLNQRIEEVASELASCETRLAEVEHALAALDHAEVEGEWVARTLGDFDAAWDALTIENRGRLVRALVRSVEVDEPTGAVTAALTEINVGDVAGEALSDVAITDKPMPAMEARA